MDKALSEPNKPRRLIFVAEKVTGVEDDYDGPWYCCDCHGTGFDEEKQTYCEFCEGTGNLESK